MSKIESFSVSLNQKDRVFYTGDRIEGFVKFKAKEPLKINSLKIKVMGQATVHWSERNDKSSGRVYYYNSLENILELEIFLISREESDKMYVNAGDYYYPFDVTLPTNLPTSFKHDIGRIGYSINAILEIQSEQIKRAKIPFSVVSHYDLNDQPNLRLSYEISGERVLNCIPCISDNVFTVTFSIFKSGYVPGEAIVFNVIVQNEKYHKTKIATVFLIQKVKFRVTNKTKICTNIIASIKHPIGACKNRTEEWKDSVLVIPSVIPSSCGQCRVVDISYEIRLNFDDTNFKIHPELIIPIIIGTVKLTSDTNTTTDSVFI